MQRFYKIFTWTVLTAALFAAVSLVAFGRIEPSTYAQQSTYGGGCGQVIEVKRDKDTVVHLAYDFERQTVSMVTVDVFLTPYIKVKTESLK